MKTVVITSQKGGSGKTTLASYLAVAVEHAGHGPAVVIDTDPQQTLATWWNAREAETPKLAPHQCRAAVEDGYPQQRLENYLASRATDGELGRYTLLQEATASQGFKTPERQVTYVYHRFHPPSDTHPRSAQ